MKNYNVGLIGCGNISNNYLEGARNVFGDYYKITAVADIVPEKARATAERFQIEKYGTPDVVYDDPTIDIVLDLTVPMAHEEVNLKAIEAGKHVYSEKPLADTLEGVKRIQAAAAKKGVRVACGPDSFMSAPNQSAKKALEDDWIGKPIGFTAMCACRGNEFWHPAPDFFYKKGAGPMLDMGFYYFNVFVTMFGPVKSIQGMQKTTFDERTIKVGARKFEKIQVEVPTYYTMNISFENGVIGTFINTMDIWKSQAPFIEIYGEKGTMILPDPNHYDGEVLIKRMNEKEFHPVPQFVEYANYRRGIGIVDMIRSIEAGTPHKASAEMAYHIMDVFDCLEKSCTEHRDIAVQSTSPQPEGLYMNQESYLWK